MSDISTQRRILTLEQQIERLRKADAGIPSGSSFPLSPPTGMRWFRSDLDFDCFYDGTRWLTVQEYPLTLTPFFINPLPFSGAGPSTVLLAALRSDYRAWYTHLNYYIFVSTTNDSTNFWTLNVTDTGSTGIWAPSTNLAGVGQSVGDTTAGVLGGSGASYVLAQLTKHVSPGAVTALHVTVYHRLVIP